MITQFKIFENIPNNTQPKVGDYVLLKTNSQTYKDSEIVNNFINNTIGKIIILSGDLITVKFDNVPLKIEDYFSKEYGRYGDITYSRVFLDNRIVAFGSTIEEVELKVRTEKYNI